jgi:hypothetical protein
VSGFDHNVQIGGGHEYSGGREALDHWIPEHIYDCHSGGNHYYLPSISDPRDPEDVGRQ